MQPGTLKIKFFTASFDFNVDTYIEEEITKFIAEGEDVKREVAGVPSIFIGSGDAGRPVLIALPYTENKPYTLENEAEGKTNL